MITLALLALAIGSLAFITSKSKISYSTRLWLTNKGKSNGGFKWIADLANCPFCSSVWMSLIATAIWRPHVPLHYYWPLGFLATALAVSAGSMAGVLVIKKAVSP